MKSLTLARFVGAISALLLMSPLGASALTISPPMVDYDLNPGDTVLDVIRVYNEGENIETVYPILMNFVADDQEGGAPILKEVTEDLGGEGLADWVAIAPEGITVAPDERINFPFSLNVPADAAPGGHYGAIVLSNTPPKDVRGGVGIGSQLAALILVNVSGEVVEAGSIMQFGFKDPKVWHNYLPIDFFLRFENAGNTHLRPTGNLFIKDMLGRQVANITVNEGFNSVLPRSIRKFDFGWHKKGFSESDSALMREWNNFGFGKYTATLVLNYGRSTNQVVTEERTFYVWPWRLICVAAGGALVILLILWVMMRLHDKSVISKYEKLKAEKTNTK